MTWAESIIKDKPYLPEAKAIETWEKDGLVFSICKNGLDLPPGALEYIQKVSEEFAKKLSVDDEGEEWKGQTEKARPFGLSSLWYCGYVRFPKEILKSDSDGFATWVPVHGGITFFQKDEDGSVVYGFDCNHSNDYGNPQMRNTKWIRAECERLALGLLVAAKHEAAYLSAPEGRAPAIAAYHEEMEKQGVRFRLDDNFGGMMKAMFGDL